MQTRDARRIVDLERRLNEERRQRLLLEQRLAGTRSALLRLQARLAQDKADAAQRRAEQPRPAC